MSAPTVDHPALRLLADTLAATTPERDPRLQAEGVAVLLGHALEATGYVLVPRADLVDALGPASDEILEAWGL